MFPNESRFTVTGDSGHLLLWIKRRTRYAQQYVYKRDRYDQSVLMWAGVMHSAEHLFTSLSEVTLHWSDIEERIFLILFVFFSDETFSTLSVYG